MADVDLEELLAALSTEEVQNLVDEFAADPDDKHVPACVRTAYRCEKPPTGDLDRDSLINHINEIALNTPDKDEKVKYEAGVKRGKVYVPVYNEAQQAEMQKEEEGKVKLDPDEEEALAGASLEDIMCLADILNTNPQDFIMEAYSDPLQYYEPEPPNETNPKDVLAKLKSNDADTKDVCLNNLNNISEDDMCAIFNTLRTNDKLQKFAACSCNISDFAIKTLCAAIEQNNALKSISLENNRISPDATAEFFDSIASPNNGLIEVRMASQQQEAMGNRIEDQIADAIKKNPKLIRLGMRFQFNECETRVAKQLIENVDKIRQKRLKDGVAPGAGVKWTAARTLD